MRLIHSNSARIVLILLATIISSHECLQISRGKAPLAPSTSPRVQTADDDVDDFVPYQGERFNLFDWNLYKMMARAYTGNLLVSPISVKLLLVLLYEGSQNYTAQQLSNALSLPVGITATRDKFSTIVKSLKATGSSQDLDFASRIYIDNGVLTRQRYGAIAKTFYDTDVFNVNFANSYATANDINLWVKNASRGNIERLITDDNSIKESVMLAANVLHFNGLWRKQIFQPNATKIGKFYLSQSETVDVPLMNTFNRFYYADCMELDAKILRIPYQGHRYSMFLLLPNKVDGLNHLFEKINPSVITKYMWLMQDLPVDVILPKFKFTYDNHLENVLRQMGIVDIFERTANLIGIAKTKRDSRKLFVTEILQKSGIEVDEKGSTAFAATGILHFGDSVPGARTGPISETILGNKVEEQTFHATRPFAFYIEDETTGTILFMGKVTNPLQIAGSTESSIPQFPSRFGEQPEGSSSAGFNADDRNNFFNIELLQAINEENAGNVIISPASVKAALTALVEGTGGRTRQEILSALRLPTEPVNIRALNLRTLAPFRNTQGGSELNLATRIWTGQNININGNYTYILQQYYASDVKTVNFRDSAGTAQMVNDWVRQQTKNNIKSLVEPGTLGPDTKLLLTSALYFKGNWLRAFDPRATNIRCFRVPDKGCRDVYLMENNANYRYAFIPSLDAEVIELPYADGKLAMLVFLPNTEGLHSLRTLSKDLSYMPMSVLLNSLQDIELAVLIPRFTINSKLQLRPSLESLGIRDLFDFKADLSKLAPNSSLYVESVLHNAKIEVNEEGTIAAAVTGISVVPLMGTTSPVFRADRPFIFALVDLQTKGLLFAGRFVEPISA